MTAIVIKANQPQRRIANHLLSILNHFWMKWLNFRDELRNQTSGRSGRLGEGYVGFITLFSQLL